MSGPQNCDPDSVGPLADAALPASAWRTLAEQSRELVCVTDADGGVVWCNRRFVDATGASPGIRLQDLAQDGPPGHAAREAVERGLGGSAVDASSLAFRAADRTVLWLDARADVDTGSGLRLWRFHDITALRFLAEQARRQGEQLDTAQEFGRLGLWERRIPSGEGRWDHHVFRFWGLEPSAGTPGFEEASSRIHPEDRHRLIYRQSTMQAGRYASRFRVVQPDGRTVRIHSQWEVRNGPDGMPDRAVGVMMDDTEVYAEASAFGNVGAQLRLAVEVGQIAIWRHDLVTDRMFYNDRGFAMLQLAPRPEGLSLDEIRALIHRDDLARVMASAEQALTSDHPTDMEARYRRADGQWRTVMTRRVTERDSDGRAIAFVGVALDVTEAVEQRRRAETLARRIEAASRAAGVGIWTTTSDGADADIDWNAQMFELFDRFPGPGAPRLNEWLEHGVHADDRGRVAETARRFLRAGPGPFEIEFRTVNRAGALRWIVMRASVDGSDHDRRRLLGVALDVTEHHVALAALRDASERARLITRYAGIGTWETKLDGHGEVWDEAMFQLRGLALKSEAPSRAERLAIVHPDDVARVIDSRPDVESSPAAAAYEFRIRLPDGRWRWLASRSAAVVDGSGKALRRVGVNWDVTEAKEAEGARQQAAIAEREMQAKSQFLSRISHELRTPLNAVLGFTQLLQLEATRAGQTAQVAKLDHIRTAGDHLLSLVNDVLDLSGVASGELKLQPCRVEIGALVREAMPLVESLAAQHGVVIAASGDGIAHADPVRLRQVLVNLLSNAIKYNRPGGRVAVESGADVAGGWLRVRDTGRGLSRLQLGRLFEPFNRFGVEHEGIEGTGIGLVIVKALVGGMGGSITVDSAPGHGTTVEVRLPPTRDAPGAGPAGEKGTAFEETTPSALHASAGSTGRPSAEPCHDAPRGCILYVEDNPVNVLLVEELVRAAGGFSIVAEASGAAGVARAKELRPDLVLVDLQLPDFDGYEVLRRLRADAVTRDIRCIALSANAMDEDIERGLAAGFTEYWTKPIDFAVFLASLKRLFPVDPA